MLRQSRHRAADHVPDIVHPGLQRRQSDTFQARPDRRHVGNPEGAQLNLLPRGDVDELGADVARYRRGLANLGRVRVAVGHAHAHHELPRRLTAEEDAGPFQAFAIALVDRLPRLLCDPRHVLDDVEAILLALDALDLVLRDNDASVVWKLDARFRSCRGGRENGAFQGPAARDGANGLHLGPARSAAGGRAGAVGDGTHAPRATQHAIDDVRLGDAV